MKEFFEPKTVAIIGASRDRTKLGNIILRNLAKSYKGKIIPVNPNADTIEGLKAAKSVKSVKEHIDLAVVVVPAKIANQTVRECVEKGIKSVIIISAGYKEVGEEGLARERELQKIIQGTKTRVIGPNCIGVFVPSTGVDTLFAAHHKLKRPSPGNIAIISQSGAFGTAILDVMEELELGVSKFVSYGNRVDVGEDELIEYLSKDDETKIISAYIEGPKDGRKLYNAIRKTTPNKPVVVLKAGKSEAGAKAAASHTGSLAGEYPVFSGAIRQAGAIEARTVREFVVYTKALSMQPPAKTKKVAIVTNGGGFGVLSADAALFHGLELGEISPTTVERIKAKLPEWATVHNPMDLLGDAGVGRFEEALEAVAQDDNIGGIIVFLWTISSTLSPEITRIITRVAEEYKKPIVAGAMGGLYTKTLMRALDLEGVPSFETPEEAVSAMRALVSYGTARERIERENTK